MIMPCKLCAYQASKIQFTYFLTYMKISKSFPQFVNEPSLFLVTGKQDAAFYKAYDGEIERIKHFKIPNPKYSDREVGYKVSPRVNEYVTQEFIHELKSQLKAMHTNDYAKMYVFTPSEIKNNVIRAVPTYLRRKTAAVIEGNYFKSTPVILLEKVATIAASSQHYIDPEARRIIEK
jgi:hypothetical protein